MIPVLAACSAAGVAALPAHRHHGLRRGAVDGGGRRGEAGAAPAPGERHARGRAAAGRPGAARLRRRAGQPAAAGLPRSAAASAPFEVGVDRDRDPGRLLGCSPSWSACRPTASRARPAARRRPADGAHRRRVRRWSTASGRCSWSPSSARSTRRAGDVSLFLPLEQARLAHAGGGPRPHRALRPLQPRRRARRRARRAAPPASRSSCGGLLPGGLAGGAARPPSCSTPRSGWPPCCSTAACRPRRPDAGGAPRSRCGPSRRIVLTLAALFSVDAFAGGLVVQSLLALWLFERFGLSLATTGVIFFWSGLLSAAVLPRRRAARAADRAA